MVESQETSSGDVTETDAHEVCKLHMELDTTKVEMKVLASELSKARVQLDMANKRLALAISLVMAIEKQPQSFLAADVKKCVETWKRRGY